MNANHDSHTTGADTASGDRRRRSTAFGTAAGVLAGGAIGLVMGVPSLTSAATDDGASTAADPAAAVAPGDEETRPEPGTKLRETLQALVDDGTITAEQADAVTTHIVENKPERREGAGRHGRHGRRGAARDGEVVAGLLGIEVDELRTQLRDGSSIADIAEENGVDPQTVIDALVDEVSGHLDLAIEDGRLTAEEAAEALDNRTERITDHVNGNR